MNTRPLHPTDLEKLRAIHSKFYKDEFNFPNFFGTFLNGFVITDDNDRILIGGGVKPLAESIIITDKDMNTISLGRALVETINVSKAICRHNALQQLHAFVQDEVYGRHLLAHGFEPVKGQALVLNL
jgi:hypothetical protein